MVTKFIDPNDDIVNYIIDNVREQDVVEFNALGHINIRCGIESSIAVSDYTKCAVVNGRPVCIFGLRRVSLLSNIGVPWMVTTNDILTARRDLLTHGKQVVQDMLSLCPTLKNVVHVDNTVNIEWLKRIGFTIGRQVIINDHNFYTFDIHL